MKDVICLISKLLTNLNIEKRKSLKEISNGLKNGLVSAVYTYSFQFSVTKHNEFHH